MKIILPFVSISTQ